MSDCPSAAHGTNRDPYGCYERERAVEARVERAVAAANAPHRRLADRYLDEGGLVAQKYAAQDRYDPARPPLRVLVAEAIAAAERRGEERARAADRNALLDLLGAVDALLRQPGTPTDALRDAAGRARHHLDRTEAP